MVFDLHPKQSGMVDLPFDFLLFNHFAIVIIATTFTVPDSYLYPSIKR
jgi:hypothetical protein